MDREERARIEEDEVRRSEDELATVGNSCGFCGAVTLAFVALVVGAVLVAWRAR